MRSKSILYGVNVPVEPSSNSENRITNNITIRNVSSDNLGEAKVEYGGESAKQEGSFETANPYANVREDIRCNEMFEHYLLKIYETILLSNNKKLLANIVSKNSIILTVTDLQELIRIKTGKACMIETEPIEVGCLGSVSNPFTRISSIRVGGTDFYISHNSEYVDIVVNYHINLKYVLTEV